MTLLKVLFEVEFESLKGCSMTQKRQEIGFMESDLLDSDEFTKWVEWSVRIAEGQCGRGESTSPPGKPHPHC